MLFDSTIEQLFETCINKKRVIYNYPDKDKDNFNFYKFIRPKIIFNKKELDIISSSIRPDYLLLYDNCSATINFINDNLKLKNYLNSIKSGSMDSYIGSYRYLLCEKDIDVNIVPESFGILNIDNVENRKFPQIIIVKPASQVNKNLQNEFSLLFKKFLFLNNKLEKIQKISANLWR